MAERRELHALCASWGLLVRAEHLPIADNLYADWLSREGDTTDRSFIRAGFHALEARFEPQSMIFLSHLNSKCRRVYSPYWSPGWAGLNALAHKWSGENDWEAPRLHLMPAVVDKIIRLGSAVCLVTPPWEAQPWYWRAMKTCSSWVQLFGLVRVLTHGALSTPGRKPNRDMVAFRFNAAA